MSTLREALKPVQRRVRLERAIRLGCLGMLFGGVCALGLQLASFLWPIEGSISLCIVILCAFTLLGALVGALWPMPQAQAARRADSSAGLMARVQTALELGALPGGTPMTDLQRQDALDALGAMDVKGSISLHPGRRVLIALGICMALNFVVAFAPNPQHEFLQAKVTFRQDMQKQAKLVEDGAKSLESTDEKALQEQRKILGDLARELRTSEDARQALTAVDTAERKLQALQKDTSQSMQSQLANQGLEDIAAALEQGDEDALQEAMQKQDSTSLTQALESAAGQAQDDALADAFRQAAESVAANNLGNAQAALQNAMNSAGLSASQADALLQMARYATARAGQAMAAGVPGSMPQALLEVGSMQSGIGGGSGQGGAGGSGKGAGTGAGSGSSNLDGGYQSSTSRQASQGNKEPKENLGTYEAIYDPTRIGGDGETAQERGVVGEGDSSEVTLGAGMGSIQDSVPYGDVAYEYQQSAVQAVQNANLPVYVQKWVESYFQSLLE